MSTLVIHVGRPAPRKTRDGVREGSAKISKAELKAKLASGEWDLVRSDIFHGEYTVRKEGRSFVVVVTDAKMFELDPAKTEGSAKIKIAWAIGTAFARVGKTEADLATAVQQEGGDDRSIQEALRAYRSEKRFGRNVDCGCGGHDEKIPPPKDPKLRAEWERAVKEREARGEGKFVGDAIDNAIARVRLATGDGEAEQLARNFKIAVLEEMYAKENSPDRRRVLADAIRLRFAQLEGG